MLSERTFITRPCKQVHLLLSKQIEKGKNLIAGARSSVQNPLNYRFVLADAYTWDEYNRTLLSQMFSTQEVLREYGIFANGLANPEDSIQEKIDALIGGLLNFTRKLDSIRDRIFLYKPPPIPATPEQQVSPPEASRRVFVVHGRDDGAKNTVARVLSQLELQPIILHEQPSKGRTVFSKFLDEGKTVEYAVVILSPDDEGHLADSGEPVKPRARQNCVLELGYFLGKLGPKRVCVVHVGDIEPPSDMSGVVYIPFDPAGNWRFQLATELHSVGIAVDANKLLLK